MNLRAITALVDFCSEIEGCRRSSSCQYPVLGMGFRAIMQSPRDPNCLRVVEMSLAMQKRLGALEGNHQNLNVSGGNAADPRGLTQRFRKVFG